MPKDYVKSFMRGQRRIKTRRRKFQHMTRYRGFKQNPIGGIHAFRRTVNTAKEGGYSCNGALASDATTTFFVFIGGAGVANTITYGAMRYYAELSSLPGLTEFTGLFDAYRIRKVTMKFIPYATTVDSDMIAASAAANLIMHYAVDYDDATLPAASQVGLEELQQYEGYHSRQVITGKGFSISFRPRVATTVYQGAFTAYAQASKKMWIDMTSTTVQHYGLKMLFEGYNGNATAFYLPFKIESTYEIELKGVR